MNKPWVSSSLPPPSSVSLLLFPQLSPSLVCSSLHLLPLFLIIPILFVSCFPVRSFVSFLPSFLVLIPFSFVFCVPVLPSLPSSLPYASYSILIPFCSSVSLFVHSFPSLLLNASYPILLVFYPPVHPFGSCSSLSFPRCCPLPPPRTLSYRLLVVIRFLALHLQSLRFQSLCVNINECLASEARRQREVKGLNMHRFPERLMSKRGTWWVKMKRKHTRTRARILIENALD